MEIDGRLTNGNSFEDPPGRKVKSRKPTGYVAAPVDHEARCDK